MFFVVHHNIVYSKSYVDDFFNFVNWDFYKIWFFGNLINFTQVVEEYEICFEDWES